MKSPSDRQLERHIRRCAGDSSNVIWTDHARSRMRQRRVTLSMALEVLRLGVFTQPPEPEMRSGALKCRMERFVAGVQVAVVVAVEHPAPELIVVTVIEVTGG